jgi:hypothetical protein
MMRQIIYNVAKSKLDTFITRSTIWLLIQFWSFSPSGGKAFSLSYVPVELQTCSLGSTAFLFAWAFPNPLKAEEYV